MSGAPKPEDPEDLLRRIGVDPWTGRQAAEALRKDPDGYARLREKIQKASMAASLLRQQLDDAVRSPPPTLLDVSRNLPTNPFVEAVADSVLRAPPFEALAKSISDNSEAAATAVAEAVERIEPIDQPAWGAFCKAAIEKVIAGVILQTVPIAKFQQHVDDRTPGARALLSIATSHLQLWPKSIEDPEQMSATESMQGLGVLEAMSKNWAVDYIVAVNKGGAMVGDYLGRRLNLDQRVGFVTYSGQKLSAEGVGSMLANAGKARVLILDDISRTGRTLRRVHAALAKRYSDAEFQCASLVGATPDEFDITSLYGYAPAVTSYRDVRLPWRTHGELIVEDDCYVFGDAGNSFPIMEAQAETIQRELLRPAD